MHSYSRMIVSALAAALFASPCPAQLPGDPIGGVVGGVLGSVTTGTPLGGVVGSATNGTPLGGVVGLAGQSGDTGLVGKVLGDVQGQLGNTANALLGVPGGVLGGVSGSLDGLAGEGALVPPTLGPAARDDSAMSPRDVADNRVARLKALIDANRATLDRDPNGQPVRRRELIATNPDATVLAIVARAGFRVTGDEQEGDLGLRLVTLSIPAGMNVRQALKTIRGLAPALQCDFNHLYEPSGGALLPVAGVGLAESVTQIKTSARIAMIDGGVASHPSLARASIEQQGFAGDPQPTGHGTAVGSLLVGEQGPFRGAARGAQLFVGDVYGGNPAAGSVSNIVRALSWAASKRPSVINISLVGPNNLALAQAIASLRGRGIQLVAAVGNDGPAAPAQYPASYSGVVSVTGVDAQGRALAEAGTATHLDFAAPGADMLAAFPGHGYTVVRGTSFAAPLAAARLAITGSYERLALEARPGKGYVGRGIVCADCRIDPKFARAN